MIPGAPPVVLDNTWCDLYRLDRPSEQHGDIVLVFALPSPYTQLTKRIPLSKHYVYQSPMTGPEDAELLAGIHLQVIPLVFAFVAGSMRVTLFDIVEPADSATPHRVDAVQVLASVQESQRACLQFANGPANVVCSAGSQIVVFSPMDCLLHLPHLIDPDVQYELQTKRALAVSGLPTPKTQIIDTELSPAQSSDDQLVQKEVARMLDPIHQRELPFVTKVQQSTGTQGTFLVRSEDGRQKALVALRNELEGLLSHRLTLEAARLKAPSLVVQEMLPGQAIGVTFFVTPTGRAVFLSCTEQLIADNGQWIGGTISYPEQDRAGQDYNKVISTIAQFCHEKGYQGPAGADVMVDSAGEYRIVDLNPRVTGSIPLALLKTHFWKTRGLPQAAILSPLLLACTKEALLASFQMELLAGSMIVLGWCYNAQKEYGTAAIAVAAETRVQLIEIVSRIRAYEMSE